ncbi:hypothetical protein [Pseudacidovorax intermedius]|uniref:hypothetical protein n=1 Tax=Pseudacidovorax intermedius TaxID=433924 RepID=UPI0012DEC66F|nr:hypothetical protein [Pseudacidovorax intermedius]
MSSSFEINNQDATEFKNGAWATLTKRIGFYWPQLAAVYCQIKGSDSEEYFIGEFAYNLTSRIRNDEAIIASDGEVEAAQIEPYLTELLDGESDELRTNGKFRALLISTIYLAIAVVFFKRQNYSASLHTTIEAYRYGGTAEFLQLVAPKAIEIIEQEGRKKSGASGGNKKKQNMHLPRQIALFEYLKNNPGASRRKVLADIDEIYPRDSYWNADDKNADKIGKLPQPTHETIIDWHSRMRDGWIPGQEESGAAS